MGKRLTFHPRATMNAVTLDRASFVGRLLQPHRSSELRPEKWLQEILNGKGQYNE
jgi:hypothetical protein